MSADKPHRAYRLTRHAEEELARRQISLAILQQVMAQPEQIVEQESGRRVYQSRIDFGEGTIYLVRVIVEDQDDPIVVVTAYRTSRLAKYWRVV